MTLGKGFCLASQQLREYIKQGKIETAFTNFSQREEEGQFNDLSLEKLVQPSSLEPQLTDDCFILDTETKGIFRPQPQESIYRTLLQLPGRQRHKVSLIDGFELRKGFTYLIPLAEKIKLDQDSYIKSSPKSSYGRLFVHTRLLADYNPCYDEIQGHYRPQELLQLWLLLQPLAFNLLVYPGLTLNQLRFFQGRDTQLSSSQIEEEFVRYPLLRKKEGKALIPLEKPMVTEEGLQIHLDLSGKDSEGIVALRARHNPNPIDVKKSEEYNAEHFFEPVLSRPMIIRRGEYYLLSSAEVLTIPPHLNVELESHSHIGIHGPLHFAGFVDNGFQGDLVFEVRSDEIADMELCEGMPISKLKVYRTAIPDKLYGEASGAHYQLQVGPRPAKFFKPFDFAFAARNYEKLDRLVLVQDAHVLNRHRTTTAEFEILSEERIPGLFKDIENGFFQSRYDCEFDELILQIIPYVIVFGPERQVFSYVRASNIKDYGDRRLFGKHSIGLGGHIRKNDGPHYLETCIEREVLQEEISITGFHSPPRLVGTLMAYDRPVDRVHFGVIYTMHTDGLVQPNESSLVSGKMVSLEGLLNDQERDQKYETWSRTLIPFLPELYQMEIPPTETNQRKTMAERTFIMIKPEHVSSTEEILADLSGYGTLTAKAVITAVPRAVVEEHYTVHRERPFYQYLVDSFVDRPVVIAIYEGMGVVQKVMECCGSTDPAKASKETIRGKYSDDSLEKAIAEHRPVRNVIHRSDSPAEAEREIEVWKTYFH